MVKTKSKLCFCADFLCQWEYLLHKTTDSKTPVAKAPGEQAPQPLQTVLPKLPDPGPNIPFQSSNKTLVTQVENPIGTFPGLLLVKKT
jgi:hypothetical protein